MQVIKATNINELKHVALEWKETCNAKHLGIEIDEPWYFKSLAKLIERLDADLFLLKTDDGIVVGYMGVEAFTSPLKRQRCAVEHHWYVMESHRGSGSMRLLVEVKDWAKTHGCKHLIMNASTLASDLHDKVCSFYEGVGMTKFETSYITEIL